MSWRPGPLKYWLARNDSGVWGDDPTGHGDVEVLRSTDISLDGSWSIDAPALRSVPSAQFVQKRLEVGDLVVVTSSGSPLHLGKTAIVTRPVASRGATFANFVQRLTPARNADSRYLWYLLNSKKAGDQMAVLGNTTTGLRNLNGGILGSVTCPGPPLAEQQAIADYLDAETARIDALISMRRCMIELFDERIRAQIFAGVQGGLTSPDGPTRESAIDWLGPIPSHWGTPWLGAYHSTQLGKMLNSEAADGPEQRRYIKNTNVRWDDFDLDDLPTMSFDGEDRLRCGLQRGDLLVCEGGEVGRAAVWPGEPADVYFQKALHRVRGLTTTEPRFLMYCLWAAASLNVFANEGNQSTIVHLTGEKLREHRLPWPPLPEQREIVGKLDRARSTTEKAIHSVSAQIALLAEHRQALITAAVTGELDIPGAA